MIFYDESHTNIISDTDELMKQCPDHLQHELNIVLSKLDESLTESLFDDTHYWNSPNEYYKSNSSGSININNILKGFCSK